MAGSGWEGPRATHLTDRSSALAGWQPDGDASGLLDPFEHIWKAPKVTGMHPITHHPPAHPRVDRNKPASHQPRRPNPSSHYLQRRGLTT